MSPQIVDIHHHIIPQIYKHALKKIGVTTAGGYPIKDWEPEDSLRMMDELGIDVGVTSISEPATLPFKKKKAAKVARQVNEYQAELKAKYPGRFKSFALLPMPHVKESIAKVKYALEELNLDGVGLLSNYGDAYLGDDQFDSMMAEINRHQGIVFVHPSSTSDKVAKPQYVFADFLEEFTFNTTRAATNLVLSGTMERYDQLKFILAHAGGTLPYLKWRIHEALETQRYIMEDPKSRLQPMMGSKKKDLVKTVIKHPVKYAKMFKQYKHGLDGWNTLNSTVSEYFSRFYYDTALSTGDATFASLKETTDVSHVLFGSDAHYAPDSWIDKMQQDISRTNYFTEEEKESIFNRNSKQLFS